ncbi:LOW QUALITY PROTEIN: polyprotein [Phytophthora megakarya]|uniref:Polyprotein n=1 Tax=Phytophthora megakarya TaxID=4795 RepID=A0A225VHN6_9STRA|nr:LOW QUALITY PROTEIN: polyprotein [Phytophthora megakarya]
MYQTYVVTHLSGTLGCNIDVRLSECYAIRTRRVSMGSCTRKYERLQAFTDADWGSNLDDSYSVSGVMVMTGNVPMVFKPKFQRTFSLSSAEAEDMTLSLCVQEVLWVLVMLKDVAIEQEEVTQIWTKLVDSKHHFTQENVQRGPVKFDYVDVKHRLADLLTKALVTKIPK